MLKEANELQGQDKEAIKRMKKTIADTEQVSGHHSRYQIHFQPLFFFICEELY